MRECRGRRKVARRLKRSSPSAAPRTLNRRTANRDMHAMALVCLANAVCCRLRPNARYKDDDLPAQAFSHFTPLPSSANKLIMEEELCTLDDRRSAAELSLKLAVVHFTTIAAYCHLLSMRGEPTKVICRKMTIFFIFPGSIIIQHVVAILAIFSAFVWVRFKKLQDSTLLRSSLKRTPFVLFGAIDQHDSQSRLHSSDEESKVKIIGRVIVVLALGAQCIGSCIIFARRYQHDATTIGDWRVLELAIAALLISLLTMVHLL